MAISGNLRPNLSDVIIGRDGRRSIAEQKIMQAMFDELQSIRNDLTSAEAKLTAISQVLAPTGGATIDAEARTAINAILAAAA